MRSAFVAGAGGAVGEAVVRHLLGRGWSVAASMHRARPDVAARLSGAGARVIVQDLDRDQDWSVEARDCDAWVFATHLERTVRALANTGRVTSRIVAFSSNNVAVHPEAAAYKALAAAERALIDRSADAAIIRPTMVYGDVRLGTVTRLLRFARWSPVLPVPGSGRARVQPVFADDLGRLAAGLAQVAGPGVYAAGGPDVVSMRDFISAIAAAAGGSPIILSVPQVMLRAAAFVPALSYSSAQAERAERHRVAVPQTPIPPELAPRTSLGDGLQAHFASLRAPNR